MWALLFILYPISFECPGVPQWVSDCDVKIMLTRVIHNQTNVGPLLVTDIDDGLPNKTVHRLEGDPKTYQRDGYANAPKQSAYIPYWKYGSTTVAGYIDLEGTTRVKLSVDKGVISKFATHGYVTVIPVDAALLGTPTVTTATYNLPAPGGIQVQGTLMASYAPEVSYVNLTSKAFLYVAGATADGDVLYVAVDATTLGANVQVEHVVAGLNTPLTVTVLGTVITVNVATDGGGLATSTAVDVASAVNGSAPASALVTAYPQGTGLDLVVAAAATNLGNIGTVTVSVPDIILAGGSVVAGTTINIPAAVLPVVAPGATSLTVTANALTSLSEILV